jgi:hypothetical protein
MSVWTEIPHRPDGCCLTDERQDTRQDRPDGNKESEFSNLYAQNLPKNSEIAFSKLVSLQLVIMKILKLRHPCENSNITL